MNWYNLTEHDIKEFDNLGYRLIEVHESTYTFEFKKNRDLEIVIETNFENPRFWKHEMSLFSYPADRHLNFNDEELEVIHEIYKKMIMLAISSKSEINLPLNEVTELHLFFRFKAKVKWNGNHYTAGEDVIGSSINYDKEKYWLFDDQESYISGLGDVTRREWVEVDPDSIEIIDVEGYY